MFLSLSNYSFSTLVQGFLLCASLIIVIGPQNLFVLRQGLQRRYRLLTASLCVIGDFVLISLGVGGMGTMIATHHELMAAVSVGSVVFLLFWGVRSLRAAWITGPPVQLTGGQRDLAGIKGTLMATLTVTLLNPGAYIDTVLMIGTTSSAYTVDERWIFGAGALCASSIWFFTLTFCASWLRPCFRHPAAWRTLDLISGCLMIGLAVALAANRFI